MQEVLATIACPAMFVSAKGELLASNPQFEQTFATDKLHELLLAEAKGLITSGLSCRIFTVEQQLRVLQSIPTGDDQFLITIQPTRESLLTRRYQAIVTAIELLPDALFISDSHHCIEIVNSRFRDLFTQFCRYGAKGRSLLELASFVLKSMPEQTKQRKAAIMRWLKRKLTTKRPFAVRFTHSDGKYLEYRDSVTPDGERVSMLIDESHFRALHLQLEQAFEQAQQLSRAKSQFLAAMSHEVKTPLNAIIGMLDLTLHDPQFAHNEYLHRIQSNSQHLLQLLNDVLDAAKLDAEKMVLASVDISLRAEMEELFSGFLGQARKRDAKLLLFVDPAAPSVIRADKSRLRQVLNNLISNGLKFNESPEPCIELRIDYEAANHAISFSVRDNGIGIAPEQHKKIFAGFEQGTLDIHGRYGGTGLGLHICQRICQLMGIELQLSSQLQKGSCFHFTLPLAGKPASLSKDISPNRLNGLEILCNDPAFIEQLNLYVNQYDVQLTSISSLPAQITDRQRVLFLPDTAPPAPELILQLNQLNAVVLYPTTPFDLSNLCPQLINMPLKWRDFLAMMLDYDHKAHSPRPIVNASEPLLNKRRILVVEDNPDNAYVICHQLKVLGQHANLAVNGTEAIHLFQHHTYDLVISDYQMPDITGAECIRRLRAIEHQQQRAHVIMVVLTADRTQACFDNSIKVGADDVLMKPLTLTSMMDFLMNSEGKWSQTQSVNHSHNLPGEMRVNESPYNIGALFRFTGDIAAEELREFMREFIRNMQHSFEELVAAVAHRKWADVERLAHSLKSSARAIGANQLQFEAEQLETICRENRPEDLRLLQWLEVKKQMERLLMVLRRDWEG
ncbi:hybrid sensor histidine kinase/response regulator [Bowmanella sp. JS7-9]|uniref:histidine kinase n=1 Tax=Pseudobowmanella zhangzhouensis TaxID=1537679 RepID=A0ABW1XNP3_9ALTE|nr:hybrid sensor histidine kinase/response regulator [Bowmanella sp. JS7-9]TBX21753.1 hypothetical protein TK45_09520 [Bowmanella sp. JS7-9]